MCNIASEWCHTHTYNSNDATLNFCSKYESPSVPQGDLKATEQKLSSISSHYVEVVSRSEKDKVDPVYQEVSTLKDVDVSHVTMEDNPAYGTSVL